jgi:integrase
MLDLVDTEAAGGGWEAGRLQALVYTLAFTGLRKGEVLHLQRSDIDLAGRILSVRAKAGWHPKTAGSTASLPIAPPLAAILSGWTRRCGCSWLFPGKRLAGPWTGGCPGTKAIDCLKAAGLRAGVPRLTFLSFRKTLGTVAKTWGFSPLELKAWLRHSNLDTQRFYDQSDVEILRPSADRIVFPRVVSSA